MIKVAAWIPNMEDGTSFYRGHGVLSEMEKQLGLESNIKITFIDTLKANNIIDLKGHDIVFFQRPFRFAEVETIKLCKQLCIPTIIDYDDNLFNVPVNNIFRDMNKQAGNSDYETHAKNCLKYSDMVFVSTEELKKQLSEHIEDTDKIKVINNAWDNEIMPMVDKYNYTQTILWRGGHSHVSDLHVFKNKFEELVRTNRDFKFVFIGEPPVWASNYKNTELIKTQELPVFFRTFRMLKPALLLTPLKDYAFNHTKSNIAKLEAVINGAICLCPDWTEWRWGIKDEHLYDHPAEFLEEANDVLEKLRSKDEQLEEEWIACIKYIHKNYTLTQMNTKRLDAFKELISNYIPDKEYFFYTGDFY